MPEWESVASDHIEAVRYDEQQRSLEIRFRDAREYRYEEFPFELYQEFQRAPGKSLFFRTRIKAMFRTTRMA